MRIMLVILVFVIAFTLTTVAFARTGVMVHNVVDLEMGARVVTDTGVNMLCILTPDGEGFTENPKKWQGFTCAKLGVNPIVWQFCRGKSNKPSLLCVNADTLINGRIQDADPGNGPKMRMNTL